ncbi:MAG: hypothetical protein ABI846_09820 [Rudaea sp.]
MLSPNDFAVPTVEVTDANGLAEFAGAAAAPPLAESAIAAKSNAVGAAGPGGETLNRHAGVLLQMAGMPSGTGKLLSLGERLLM